MARWKPGEAKPSGWHDNQHGVPGALTAKQAAEMAATAAQEGGQCEVRDSHDKMVVSMAASFEQCCDKHNGVAFTRSFDVKYCTHESPLPPPRKTDKDPDYP